ncbi:hypothetical protein TPAR_06485 [Tolypocladium paradoxum]|uniref:Uncharacterized protein n=1 Tax=Tolypocladium paradoxum TaxID=94208 RepID=A0A2S4KT23_9HYPO|nr:hypothetical protein TPAR_06485 [Tolypocladium paradoxum]
MLGRQWSELGQIESQELFVSRRWRMLSHFLVPATYLDSQATGLPLLHASAAPKAATVAASLSPIGSGSEGGQGCAWLDALQKPYSTVGAQGPQLQPA